MPTVTKYNSDEFKEETWGKKVDGEDVGLEEYNLRLILICFAIKMIVEDLQLSNCMVKKVKRRCCSCYKKISKVIQDLLPSWRKMLNINPLITKEREEIIDKNENENECKYCGNVFKTGWISLE